MRCSSAASTRRPRHRNEHPPSSSNSARRRPAAADDGVPDLWHLARHTIPWQCAGTGKSGCVRAHRSQKYLAGGGHHRSGARDRSGSPANTGLSRPGRSTRKQLRRRLEFLCYKYLGTRCRAAGDRRNARSEHPMLRAHPLADFGTWSIRVSAAKRPARRHSLVCHVPKRDFRLHTQTQPLNTQYNIYPLPARHMQDRRSTISLVDRPGPERKPDHRPGRGRIDPPRAGARIAKPHLDGATGSARVSGQRDGSGHLHTTLRAGHL